MLTSLRLENFKGFRDATLRLGPLSLVIGANASGKSNLRDALRFLHGVARGYNLAEILGEKYGEGGYREWSGIRGGVREVCREGTERFKLTLEFETPTQGPVVTKDHLIYELSVEIPHPKLAPRLRSESLLFNGRRVLSGYVIYEGSGPFGQGSTWAEVPDGLGGGQSHTVLSSQQPALTQFFELGRHGKWFDEAAKQILDDTVNTLASMRFLDLSPEAMRRPSIPGQTILSDQGENLSSVLQAICADAKNKERLARAIQELTPMDVADFDFVADAQGKVLVYLIEKDGRRISAYSASDGTLRFLGILAALLGPKPAKFYFLEELEAGIHPAQLYLLMDHLQARTRKGDVQILGTTHSPQILRLLDEKEFADSSLTYRVEGVPEARIRALPDVPHLSEVLREKGVDLARLYEGAWMEQTMFFEEGEPEPFELDPVEGMPA